MPKAEPTKVAVGYRVVKRPRRQISLQLPLKLDK